MPREIFDRLFKDAAQVHKRKNDPKNNMTCGGEVSNDYFNRARDASRDGTQNKPSWRAWSNAGKTFEHRPALLTAQSADPENDKAPSKTTGEVRANFAAGLRCSSTPAGQKKESWKPTTSKIGNTFEDKPTLLAAQSADPQNDRVPSKTTGEVRANFVGGLRSSATSTPRKESWKPTTSRIGNTFEDKPAHLTTQSPDPQSDKAPSKTGGEVNASFTSSLRSGSFTAPQMQRKSSWKPTVAVPMRKVHDEQPPMANKREGYRSDGQIWERLHKTPLEKDNARSTSPKVNPTALFRKTTLG